MRALLFSELIQCVTVLRAMDSRRLVALKIPVSAVRFRPRPPFRNPRFKPEALLARASCVGAAADAADAAASLVGCRVSGGVAAVNGTCERVSIGAPIPVTGRPEVSARSYFVDVGDRCIVI